MMFSFTLGATTDKRLTSSSEKYLDSDTGKFDLAKSNLLVYAHGGYYEMGSKIGKFGWSVEKKK